MTFRGRDLFSIHVPRSGARYTQRFEWADAAHWWGYKWEEFVELDGEEQSFLVAVYRAHHQLQAVIQKDLMKKAT